jgi:hypothetical protein
MSLLKQITKPVREMFADQGSGHAAEDSTKRKFVVTLTGKDGAEVEKNVKAYSITDIKAHFGQAFVSAELHPDEAGTSSDFTHSDDEDDDRTSDEVDADDTDLDEAMTTPDERKKKDFDFKRLMAGAMSRDEFNKKWKVGPHAPKPPKLAGPGGVYKNLLVKLGEAAAPEGEYPVGTTVIYKTIHRGHYMMSKVKSVRANALLLVNGATIEPKAVVSTDPQEWKDKYSLEEAAAECKPPAGLDAEEKFAYRKGWQNPDDTPEDWEFKSSSKQGKAFMRGRMDCKGLDEGVITEMAKRTSPAEFYKLAVAKHGIKNAGHMSWAMIKGVADEADILIPAYIRDNKIGRGVWDAKPKDMKAAAHEPVIAAKEEPKAAPKAEPKVEPKKDEPKEPKGAPVPEKKPYHEKHDFPEAEFAWTTTYSEPRELYAAIKQHHGVEHSDTERVQVGKSSTGRHGVVLAAYYILKKGTQDVLGRWTVTGGDKIPGRGFVSYGEGNIALSKKAQKNRDDNMFGFLIKPQHGSPFVSVGTQHSHGPWDKFSAEANVRDKYEHYAYDDDFGHGTIQVVKVVKKNGKWERA